MSIKVMTLVWDGFPAAGSELLTMLALADWCDDRGGSLYPSIKAVGEKVRIGEKHARNILHKFEHERYLAVVGNHFGGKPGTTREYRLNVGKLKLLADEANAKREAEKAAKYGAKKSAGDQWEDVFDTAPPEVTPHLQFPDGSPVVTKTAPLEVTLSTIDPPIEPLEKKKEAQKPVFPKISFDGTKFQDLTDEQVSVWSGAYPAVKVPAEILKAAAWLDANPANKKSDYKRFLNGWLSRAQDKAPRVQDGAAPARQYTPFTPINKQEALEARNREVARKWAAGE